MVMTDCQVQVILKEIDSHDTCIAESYTDSFFILAIRGFMKNNRDNA